MHSTPAAGGGPLCHCAAQAVKIRFRCLLDHGCRQSMWGRGKEEGMATVSFLTRTVRFEWSPLCRARLKEKLACRHRQKNNKWLAGAHECRAEALVARAYQAKVPVATICADQAWAARPCLRTRKAVHLALHRSLQVSKQRRTSWLSLKRAAKQVFCSSRLVLFGRRPRPASTASNRPTPCMHCLQLMCQSHAPVYSQCPREYSWSRTSHILICRGYTGCSGTLQPCTWPAI